MKYSKISNTLSALMLGLFCVLMAVAVLLGVGNFAYKSYIAAFAFALLLFVGYLLLRKKLGNSCSILDRVSRGKLLALLSFLCLLVNGAWIIFFRIEPSADFKTYWLYAQSLAENKVAINHYVSLFPHIFGFSYLVSLLIKIFGANQLLVPVCNVILTCCSGILVFNLCEKEYGKKAAAYAYILWIICPSKLIYNAMVLSEPLYTFLILLFIYIVYSLDSDSNGIKKKAIVFILAGLTSGLILRVINCVRPISAILLIAFAIWFLLLRGEKVKRTDSWKTFGLFVVLVLTVYIPTKGLWNSYVTERMGEEPSTVTGYSVYVGFNPETGGSYSNDDMNELFSCYFGQNLSATESHQVLLEKAKERMKSGEINYPVFITGKIRTFLGNDEGGAFYASEALSSTEYSLLCIISNVFYYFLVLLSVAGALLLIRTKRYSALQLCPLYILGLTCAHMLVEVAGRYHYSIIPMLILTAAAFLGKSKES